MPVLEQLRKREWQIEAVENKTEWDNSKKVRSNCVAGRFTFVKQYHDTSNIEKINRCLLLGRTRPLSSSYRTNANEAAPVF